MHLSEIHEESKNKQFKANSMKKRKTFFELKIAFLLKTENLTIRWSKSVFAI
jgi:hypothetical protein